MQRPTRSVRLPMLARAEIYHIHPAQRMSLQPPHRLLDDFGGGIANRYIGDIGHQIAFYAPILRGRERTFAP